MAPAAADLGARRPTAAAGHGSGRSRQRRRRFKREPDRPQWQECPGWATCSLVIACAAHLVMRTRAMLFCAAEHSAERALCWLCAELISVLTLCLGSSRRGWSRSASSVLTALQSFLAPLRALFLIGQLRRSFVCPQRQHSHSSLQLLISGVC